MKHHFGELDQLIMDVKFLLKKNHRSLSEKDKIILRNCLSFFKIVKIDGQKKSYPPQRVCQGS